MKKDIFKISSNAVSLAGEFAVLSQLVLRGYDANMTLGRTKNVDILVSNPQNGKMYKLEVKTNLRDVRKTRSKSKIFGQYEGAWIMSGKHEKIFEKNLFYCFVNISKGGNVFRFFIVPSKVVANYVQSQHAYWLKKTPKGKDTDMRLFRIGIRGEPYEIPTATVEDYENNWIFRR
jgi:hypothetical protein